jgi:nitrate/nitrite transporter NarK
VLGLIGLCFAASGFIAAQPIFWSHASARLAGITAAAGIAFINSLGAIGAFVAPNIRVLAEKLVGTNEAGLYTLSALTMLSAILMFLVRVDDPANGPVRRL